jgi:hypothetical protein
MQPIANNSSGSIRENEQQFLVNWFCLTSLTCLAAGSWGSQVTPVTTGSFQGWHMIKTGPADEKTQFSRLAHQ